MHVYSAYAIISLHMHVHTHLQTTHVDLHNLLHDTCLRYMCDLCGPFNLWVISMVLNKDAVLLLCYQLVTLDKIYCIVKFKIWKP